MCACIEEMLDESVCGSYSSIASVLCVPGGSTVVFSEAIWDKNDFSIN